MTKILNGRIIVPTIHDPKEGLNDHGFVTTSRQRVPSRPNLCMKLRRYIMMNFNGEGKMYARQLADVMTEMGQDPKKDKLAITDHIKA